MDETISMDSGYETSQATGQLRWVVPNQSGFDAKKLQQEFQIISYRGGKADARKEWRDVPYEIDPTSF
jgi:hypothetical protein